MLEFTSRCEALPGDQMRGVHTAEDNSLYRPEEGKQVVSTQIHGSIWLWPPENDTQPMSSPPPACMSQSNGAAGTVQCVFLLDRSETCYAAKDELKILVVLLPPPKCWNYMYHMAGLCHAGNQIQAFSMIATLLNKPGPNLASLSLHHSLEWGAVHVSHCGYLCPASAILSHLAEDEALTILFPK